MNTQTIQRVAQRWLRAIVHVQAHGVVEIVNSANKVLKAVLPGVTTKYTSKGLLSSPGQGPVWFRHQLPGTGNFAGFFAAPEIPFQAIWDEAHKVFLVTSFTEELRFRNSEGLVAFLAVPAKVSAFLHKGLESIDPRDAALFSGKSTPDVLIRGVMDVKAQFKPVEEWHTTTLTVTLALRTPKPVSTKGVETWLQAHWSEVQAKAPAKVPAVASLPHRHIEDEDGSRNRDDHDWEMDQPAVGLGWVQPNHMLWVDVDSIDMDQSGDKVIVQISSSIR